MSQQKTAVRATNAKLALATAFLGIAALAAAGAGASFNKKPDLFIRSIVPIEPGELPFELELPLDIKSAANLVVLRVIYGNIGDGTPVNSFWLRLAFSPALDVDVNPPPPKELFPIVTLSGYTAWNTWFGLNASTTKSSAFKVLAHDDGTIESLGWKVIPPGMNRYDIAPAAYGSVLVIIGKSSPNVQTYDIRALIDSEHQVIESDKRNNTYVTRGAGRHPLTGIPLGNFFAHDNGTMESLGWQVIPSGMNRYDIAPGEYGSFIVLVDKTSFIERSYYIRGEIDNEHHIDESNEHNNSYATKIAL